MTLLCLSCHLAPRRMAHSSTISPLRISVWEGLSLRKCQRSSERDALEPRCTSETMRVFHLVSFIAKEYGFSNDHGIARQKRRKLMAGYELNIKSLLNFWLGAGAAIQRLEKRQ